MLYLSMVVLLFSYVTSPTDCIIAVLSSIAFSPIKHLMLFFLFYLGKCDILVIRIQEAKMILSGMYLNGIAGEEDGGFWRTVDLIRQNGILNLNNFMKNGEFISYLMIKQMIFPPTSLQPNPSNEYYQLFSCFLFFFKLYV